MNYYAARKRMTGDAWDFTNLHDGEVWPVGYCAGWPNFEVIRKYAGEEQAAREEERMTPFRNRFHVCGHATKEEAEQCYANFLIEQRLRLEQDGSVRKRCLECGEWTNYYASINSATLPLCREHLNKETVLEHWAPPTLFIVA